MADVYDALTSKRPYKEAFSHEKSMAIILEGRGTHFDPDIADAFIAREREFIRIREQYQDRGGLSPIQRLGSDLDRLERERAEPVS